MKFKFILPIVLIILLTNCNSDNNNDNNDLYRGVWRIESITPPIISSNPNAPDCRLLNDQVNFNDFGQITWSYPLPDSFGQYNQPCGNSTSELYNYTIENDILKIRDIDTNEQINWTFELNGQFLTITRPNSVTVYKKVQ